MARVHFRTSVVVSARVGGIDFKTDDERPDYQDFAYVAFTVGMTVQCPIPTSKRAGQDAPCCDTSYLPISSVRSSWPSSST